MCGIDRIGGPVPRGRARGDALAQQFATPVIVERAEFTPERGAQAPSEQPEGVRGIAVGRSLVQQRIIIARGDLFAEEGGLVAQQVLDPAGRGAPGQLLLRGK